MTSNRTDDTSHRCYARLLGLYPQEFRDEYGPSMLQLFSDQCRSAFRDNGTMGMVFLWLRTLTDLIASVLQEHIASPRASWGLMEAVPDEPLPWKGVSLVLIPGLVFFIGQIGQLAGQDWFFLLARRAAYFLIIPVLLVWLFTRKFPIWGLIPLGMLSRILLEVGSKMEYIVGKSLSIIFDSSWSPLARLSQIYPWVMDIQINILVFIKTRATEISLLTTAILLLSMGFLIIRIARRRGYPRTACAWTGIFIILSIVDTLSFSGFFALMEKFSWNPSNIFGSVDLPAILGGISSEAFYNLTIELGFLILILVGAFLGRCHGRLALLFPLGYLIPTIVLGRLDYDPAMPYLLFLAGAAVLTYRVLVALIAPIWIVRSASARAQRRAAAVGLLAAIGILVVAHIGYIFATFAIYGWKIDASFIYYTVSPELITLAGIALAVSLYKTDIPAKPAIKPSPITAGGAES